jgi:hypothetical protein
MSEQMPPTQQPDAQKPGEQQPNTQQPSTPTDWRSQRAERREQRHAAREERRANRGGSWIIGAALVVLGAIFLIQNLTGYSLQNWWALFILIPAIGSFASAWRIYQANGQRLTTAVRGPAIGGLILTLVALIFLLGLNWGTLWPVFIIVGGLALLLNALAG